MAPFLPPEEFLDWSHLCQSPVVFNVAV
jgi:hypothetical protein